MTKRLHHTKYYRGTGKNPTYINSVKYDPHFYGLGLIEFVHFCKSENYSRYPLGWSELQQIRVNESVNGGNDYCKIITVKAPPKVWKLAEQAYQSYLKNPTY